MKILVTGVGGQLGHDVMNELIGRGHTGVGIDIALNIQELLMEALSQQPNMYLWI